MARRLKYEIEIDTDNQVVEAIIDHKLRKLQLSLAKTKGGRLIIDKSSAVSTAELDDKAEGNKGEAVEQPKWTVAYIRMMDRRIAGFAPMWLAGIAKTEDGDYRVQTAYPLHIYMEHVEENEHDDTIVTAQRYKQHYGMWFDLDFFRLNNVIDRIIKRDRIALDYMDADIARATIRELADSTVHTEILRVNLSFPVLEVSRCSIVREDGDQVELTPEVGSNSSTVLRLEQEPYDFHFKNKPIGW